MTKRIIVALDYPDPRDAQEFISKIEPSLCRLKIGKEMFTRMGPQFVSKLVKAGYDVFLDLKFHDIPHTVSQAVKAAADLGVWMVDIHASGGRRMMESARKALHSFGNQAPLLIGVTVLTSMTELEFKELNISISIEEQVNHLAELAYQSDLDGVVCSAMEAESLRLNLPRKFQLVTPGIRPAGAAANDQRRIVTPTQALKWGASYLVIGRPITQSSSPVEALLTLNREISEALSKPSKN